MDPKSVVRSSPTISPQMGSRDIRNVVRAEISNTPPGDILRAVRAELLNISLSGGSRDRDRLRTIPEISNTPSPEASRDIMWNDRLEQAAKNIGESSKSYKLMHIKEAQRATKAYNRLMIFGIILGPLSGVLSALDAAIDTNNDPTLPIIVTVLGFLAGIIVATVKFGKYGEVSNANKQAAARYTSVESSVRRQLGLYRTDRVLAIPYMDWLETKYEELFLSAPLLPAGAYDRYANIAKKLGLSVPNQYEAVITINSEYEDTKVQAVGNVANIEINVGDSPKKEEISGDVEEGGYASAPSVSVNESPEQRADRLMPTPGIKGNKRIRRTGTMAQFPALNECSDKMLQYELKRMMGFE